jgi:hypothetical protein
MKKALKWVGIVLAVLIVGGFIAFKVMQANTKKHSPEDTVAYTKGDLELSVFYNRPYKKGREIFGGLEPYGEVWRTGANEATTFETNRDLSIGGKTLPAGKYTLWTIPGPDTWTVIFNGKMYGWGVSFGGVASRDPIADVVQVEVPVQKLDSVVEQFTIAFEEQNALALALSWDQTKVAVPMK